MKKRNFLKGCSLAFLGSSLSGLTHQAFAADYPSRSIRLVVGYPPGGTTDLLGRLVANKLSEIFKQSVAVENRGGAGGGIGADMVARSAPDGYTLGMATAGNLALNYLQYKVPYDSLKDFTLLTNIATVPNVLLVNSKTPVNDLSQLVDYFKNKGGAFFGSTGTGNSPHLMGELFKLRTGLNLTHVPYQGSAPATTALLAGDIDMLFDNLPSVQGLIQSGRVKAIAISSAERMSSLPNVKTFEEQGFKDFVINGWFALIAPAQLEKQALARLNAAIAEMRTDEKFLTAIKQTGGIPDIAGGIELRKLVESERKRWPELVKQAGLKLERN